VGRKPGVLEKWHPGSNNLGKGTGKHIAIQKQKGVRHRGKRSENLGTPKPKGTGAHRDKNALAPPRGGGTPGAANTEGSAD